MKTCRQTMFLCRIFQNLSHREPNILGSADIKRFIVNKGERRRKSRHKLWSKIRSVSFKNIFRCWRKNHLLNNPEGTFLGKSCPYKKFNRPTEGSSMKCLHLICPQQWGQIDGPFWSLRHFGYSCECFRWLPRGGPYPRGPVRVRFSGWFSLDFLLPFETVFTNKCKFFLSFDNDVFLKSKSKTAQFSNRKKKPLQRCRKLSGFRFDLTPEILVQIIAKHDWISFRSLPAICCFRALMLCYIIFGNRLLATLKHRRCWAGTHTHQKNITIGRVSL